MAAPLVSVIIPTYKRANFLIRAIKSVLNQKYINIEIIVVDDNGEGEQQEKTKIIVSKFSDVKLETYPTNRGACYARNRGAKVAVGEILMFLDDDDYYLEGKIEKQLKVLSDKTVDACLCGMKRIDENKNEINTKENYPRGTDLKSFILEGNCFTTMIAIRTVLFLRIGGFSEISRFQDKYFMYKFHKNNCKLKLLNEQLFVLSEHTNERISFGKLEKISLALFKIFEFENSNFSLFNNEEQLFLKNKYYMSMALIRINENLGERIYGIVYIFKCNWIVNNDVKNKIKLLIQLIFRGNRIQKLKNIIVNYN